MNGEEKRKRRFAATDKELRFTLSRGCAVLDPLTKNLDAVNRNGVGLTHTTLPDARDATN